MICKYRAELMHVNTRKFWMYYIERGTTGHFTLSARGQEEVMDPACTAVSTAIKLKEVRI